MTDTKTFDQKCWEYDVASYDRAKRMLELALKAGRVKTIDFCRERLKELQSRWPNCKMD